jgi:UDP-GlcNAc:undecaprenyl-phosphate GlcNAc-1-phosphate transferase
VNHLLYLFLPAFAAAFVFSLASLPSWRAWCRRIGLVDDPGHRKIHDEPIPLAGGFAVLTGMVLPLILAAAAVATDFPISDLGQRLESHGLKPGNRAVEMGAILIGAIAILVLGWLDDKHELKPLAKFAGQFVIAAFTAAANVRITLFVHNAAFSYAVTILWILTVINAFNFMDNMNGLCSGLGAIASFCFALMSAIEGQELVAVVGLLMCGALLGFLPWNFPRAKAFLGDAGSHLVGYLLAVMSILPHFYSHKSPHHLAVLTPLAILAVPLGDLAYVVVLRWRMGKPFYSGDTNHLSHRLVRNGLSRTGAVVCIWIIAVLLGLVAVAANVW